MSLVNSEYVNERPADQNITASIDTTSTNTKTRSALGDLSHFPREIRDGIYRHVFPTYRASYRHRSSTSKPTVLELTDVQLDKCNWTVWKLSILRLSRNIRSEAMPIFYSKGIFRFHIGLREEFSNEVPQLPDVEFINFMSNVEIIYDARIRYDWSERASRIYGAASAGPLELFQGAKVSRNSIVIMLNWCEMAASYAADMTNSPLFRSLRQMIGFKNVTLRFTTNENVYCPLPGISQAKEKEWVEAGTWKKLYGGFTPLFLAMSKDLEPTLGKSSAMSKLVPGEPGGTLEVSGRRAIKFHPRGRQAITSRANKDTTDLESMNMDRSVHGYEVLKRRRVIG